MTDGPLFDPFALFRTWYSQPILPGWSFGNLVVNEGNSSAPATEAAIVAQESYGRQLGKLMDAVNAIIQRQGGPAGVQALEELVELRGQIEDIKAAAVTDHLKRVGQDLAHLKTHDKGAYKAAVRTLRAMLPDE
jgi:hypothetical protein